MDRFSHLPGVLGEAPLVGLEDLLAPGELELSTPESLDRGGAVVVLRADGDDDLPVQCGRTKKETAERDTMGNKPGLFVDDRRFEHGSWTWDRGRLIFWAMGMTREAGKDIHSPLGLGSLNTCFAGSVHEACRLSLRKSRQSIFIEGDACSRIIHGLTTSPWRSNALDERVSSEPDSTRQ